MIHKASKRDIAIVPHDVDGNIPPDAMNDRSKEEHEVTESSDEIELKLETGRVTVGTEK